VGQPVEQVEVDIFEDNGVDWTALPDTLSKDACQWYGVEYFPQWSGPAVH
jgi:hypothetical protein